MKEKHFTENIHAIRKRVQWPIEQGARTNAYVADRNAGARSLNQALATKGDDLNQSVEKSWHPLSGTVEKASGEFK